MGRHVYIGESPLGKTKGRENERGMACEPTPFQRKDCRAESNPKERPGKRTSFGGAKRIDQRDQAATQGGIKGRREEMTIVKRKKTGAVTR